MKYERFYGYPGDGIPNSGALGRSVMTFFDVFLLFNYLLFEMTVWWGLDGGMLSIS